MCDDGDGILLKKSAPVLFEISLKFSDLQRVTALAVYMYLLEDVEPGGADYVDSLTAAGAVPSPVTIVCTQFFGNGASASQTNLSGAGCSMFSTWRQ